MVVGLLAASYMAPGTTCSTSETENPQPLSNRAFFKAAVRLPGLGVQENPSPTSRLQVRDMAGRTEPHPFGGRDMVVELHKMFAELMNNTS